MNRRQMLARRSSRSAAPRSSSPTSDRSRLGVVPGQLEPELGRLVHDLEQQLVAVHPLAGALLQPEQLFRVEVPLVVAPGLAGQDGTVQRRLPGLL